LISAGVALTSRSGWVLHTKHEYIIDWQGIQCGLTLGIPFGKLGESGPGLQTLLCSRVYSNQGKTTLKLPRDNRGCDVTDEIK
jgi:hypothetical protein